MFIQFQNFGHGSSLKSTYHQGVYEMIPRIHQFPEIVYVLEGTIEITVDKKREVAHAGDLAVITPFRAHAFHTPSYCHIWIGRLSNDFISDFISGENMYISGDRAVFTPSAPLRHYVEGSLPAPCDDFLHLEFDPIRYRATKALAFTIFEEYMRTVPQTAASLKNDALASVLLYMNDHFKENISLSSVCAATGYSANYISHCISVIPHTNFRTLLNSLRVDYAKALLVNKDFNIIDIALEAGFSGERSFYRAFTALVGMSPGAYRAKKRMQS